jgi:hypothetical protein
MLVDTDNLVSTDEFRRDFEKFVKAVKGKGPVAVMIAAKRRKRSATAV